MAEQVQWYRLGDLKLTFSWPHCGFLAAPNGPGTYATTPVEGMLHHSQFKCVEIVSDDDYAELSDAGEPSHFYKQSLTSMQQSASWDVNNCTSSNSLAPTGTDPNPSIPVVTCNFVPSVDSSLQVNQVHWVATSYQG